jgi:hypothetical protein
MQTPILLELLGATRQQTFLEEAERQRLHAAVASAQPQRPWGVRWKSFRTTVRSFTTGGWRSRHQQAVCASASTSEPCCTA